MPTSFLNVPSPKSKSTIVGTVEHNWIGLAAQSVGPYSEHVATLPICKSYHCQLENVSADLKKWFADELADVARQARDIGFEQGRHYIREALGL